MSLDTRLRSLADDHDPAVGAHDLDDALQGALALGHRKVVRRRSGLAALALVAVVGIGTAVLAAGGDDKDTGLGVVSPSPDTPDTVVDENPPPTPPTTAAPQTTPTTSAPVQAAAPGQLPKAGQPIANGRYFGFVRSVDPAKRTISFDVAQWLEGEEARKAAREDGKDDTADFYVRNNSKEARTLTVKSDASLVVYEGDPNDSRKVDLAGLSREAKASELFGWVTLKDGVVLDFEEQWIP